VVLQCGCADLLGVELLLLLLPAGVRSVAVRVCFHQCPAVAQGRDGEPRTTQYTRHTPDPTVSHICCCNSQCSATDPPATRLLAPIRDCGAEEEEEGAVETLVLAAPLSMGRLAFGPVAAR